ncbi:MAG: hypothetical protein H7837_10875 [Magnetococcus sp. MYC-9]
MSNMDPTDTGTGRDLLDQVDCLLSELERVDFRIGIDKRVAIRRLLLIAPDRQLVHVLPMLGPLLCTDPVQQRLFWHTAERFVNPGQTADQNQEKKDIDQPPATAGNPEASLYGYPPENPDIHTSAGIEKKAERQRRWLELGIGLPVLGLLVLVLWLIAIPPPEPKSIESASDKQTALELSFQWTFRWSDAKWPATFLPLLVAGWAMRRQRDKKRFLHRHLTNSAGHRDSFHITQSPNSLFGVELRSRFRRLRQPQETATRKLDRVKTLRATLRKGGYPTLHCAMRRQTAEYLLISRNLSNRAQWYRASEGLVADMRSEDISVRHYAFWRTGIRLAEVQHSDKDGEPDHRLHTLESLAARFPQHRLLVMDEARYLIGRQGMVASWAEDFRAWSQKSWIATTPSNQWGAGEAVAKELGFQVISLTDGDPLMEMGAFFAPQGPTVRPDPDQSMGPFPPSLRYHPERFTVEESPGAVEIKTLLAELEQYLGDAAWRWLQACAVFPTLDPVITQRLGERLPESRDGRIDQGGRSLYTLPRFAALGRLPWFRNGDMPDWLRQTLVDQIKGLGQSWYETVRETVLAILTTSDAKNAGPASMDVIRRDQRYLIDRLIDRFRARSATEAQRAQLLIDFLDAPTDLDLPLPQRLFKAWDDLKTPNNGLIAALGMLGAVLGFTFFDRIIHGLPGWVYNTFGPVPNRLVTLILAAATGILALSALGWWLVDMLRNDDARRKRHPQVLWLSGLTLLAGLLAWADAAVLAILWRTIQRTEAWQDNPGLLVWQHWPNLQFLLGLLALSSAWLRAAVDTSLPPRIAAPTLLEMVLTLSLWRIFGRLLLVMVGGWLLLSAVSYGVIGTSFQGWFIHDGYYLFAFVTGEDFENALRPILFLPLLTLGLALVLKSALERERILGGLVMGAAMGAMIGEILLVSTLGISNHNLTKFAIWLSPCWFSLSGITLVLYRHWLLRFKTAATFLAGFIFLLIIDWWMSYEIRGYSPRDVITNKKDMGYFFYWFPFVSSPTACWAVLRFCGYRIPIIRSFIVFLLSLTISFGTWMSLAVFIGISEQLFYVLLDQWRNRWINGALILSSSFLILFNSLLWIKWTLVGFRKPKEGYLRAGAPWLLVPVLAGLTFGYQMPGEKMIYSLAGILPLIALMLGQKFGKTGFWVFAIGAAPLMMGMRSITPFSLFPKPDLYLLGLFLCRSTYDLTWLEQILTWLRKSYLSPILLLFLLPISASQGNQFIFGWTGISLWVFGVFLCGLLGVWKKSLLIAGTLITGLGLLKATYDVQPSFYPLPFHNLMGFVGLMNLWVAFWVGHVAARVLASTANGSDGLPVYVSGDHDALLLKNVLRNRSIRPIHTNTVWLRFAIIVFFIMYSIALIDPQYNYFDIRFPAKFILYKPTIFLAYLLIGLSYDWRTFRIFFYISIILPLGILQLPSYNQDGGRSIPMAIAVFAYGMAGVYLRRRSQLFPKPGIQKLQQTP